MEDRNKKINIEKQPSLIAQENTKLDAEILKRTKNQELRIKAQKERISQGSEEELETKEAPPPKARYPISGDEIPEN